MLQLYDEKGFDAFSWLARHARMRPCVHSAKPMPQELSYNDARHSVATRSQTHGTRVTHLLRRGDAARGINKRSGLFINYVGDFRNCSRYLRPAECARRIAISNSTRAQRPENTTETVTKIPHCGPPARCPLRCSRIVQQFPSTKQIAPSRSLPGRDFVNDGEENLIEGP